MAPEVAKAYRRTPMDHAQPAAPLTADNDRSTRSMILLYAGALGLEILVLLALWALARAFA